MLKAIWVDEDDEDIICEALWFYQEYAEMSAEQSCRSLYKIRALTNRVERGREV